MTPTSAPASLSLVKASGIVPIEAIQKAHVRLYGCQIIAKTSVAAGCITPDL